MIYNEQIALEIASLLLEVKAIQIKKQDYFTWSSGWKSPIYCDNRVLLGYPDARNKVKVAFEKLLKEKFPECNALCGVATAGIGHGAFLADSTNLSYSYVRSKAKEHGRQNQIEGYIPDGSKIVMIEDLISTGGSVVKALQALDEADYNVIGVLAIFSYGFPQSRRAFEGLKLPWATLSDYGTLLKLMQEKGELSAEELERLEGWRLDPEGWG